MGVYLVHNIFSNIATAGQLRKNTKQAYDMKTVDVSSASSGFKF